MARSRTAGCGCVGCAAWPSCCARGWSGSTHRHGVHTRPGHVLQRRHACLRPHQLPVVLVGSLAGAVVSGEVPRLRDAGPPPAGLYVGEKGATWYYFIDARISASGPRRAEPAKSVQNTLLLLSLGILLDRYTTFRLLNIEPQRLSRKTTLYNFSRGVITSTDDPLPIDPRVISAMQKAETGGSAATAEAIAYTIENVKGRAAQNTALVFTCRPGPSLERRSRRTAGK
ncbi:uncharacterized protein BO66DRAFT_405307 [Aspergillus aculeatinus CBS 121060]|uniref:Uncharacterized protein n=1 Tax=Aspergillus aculeatinus CBS 121060 TaxID=1448322 RepID=A0ACD1GW15_9EURO|nr:hypothetical protein BO66DRAFT_405307 [Aspergillus aculeatinus CBS 121060]RAH65656.1 hypothetical protein BO66DRAFT_405307 [Aspergillus aculeatinus CBS 121060]